MNSKDEVLQTLQAACAAGECLAIPNLVRQLQQLSPTKVMAALEALRASGSIFELATKKTRWHVKGCPHAIEQIGGVSPLSQVTDEWQQIEMMRHEIDRCCGSPDEQCHDIDSLAAWGKTVELRVVQVEYAITHLASIDPRKLIVVDSWLRPGRRVYHAHTCRKRPRGPCL